MATPVLKYPVEVIVIRLRSRYRQMELAVKTCLETKEVTTELWQNSATKEDDENYKLFLKQLKSALERNHWACRETISKYMHHFFGENIEVQYAVLHAIGQVEVLHPDEIVQEMEGIRSLQGLRVYRRENALFVLKSINEEHTVYAHIVI